MHGVRPRRPYREPCAGDALPLAEMRAEELVEGGFAARAEPFEVGAREGRREIAGRLASAGWAGNLSRSYLPPHRGALRSTPERRISRLRHASQGSCPRPFVVNQNPAQRIRVGDP